MSKSVEILAFSGLALSAHLALWAWVGEDGSDAAGQSGEAVVTLTAASDSVANLVEAWATAPEVLEAVTEVMPTPAVDTLPEIVPIVALPELDPPPEPVHQTEQDNAPKAPEAAKAPPLPEPPQMAPLEPPPDEIEQAILLPETRSPMLPQAKAIEAPALPKLAEALPQIDHETPSPSPAPRVSLRPKERPAELVKTTQPTRQAKATPKAQTKPKSEQSAASTQQKAAGSGQGKQAGKTKKTKTASLSKAQTQSLIGSWGASIRSGVERRKRYPSGTAASGTSVVRLTVSPKGSLLKVGLVKSSGDKRLDRAAVEAVRRARIPKAPKGLTQSSYSFNLPIAFSK